ncbi:hypothetical protein J6590_001790 [Homalodisca vitripennis]|nr:hypothetical protein J6590_001790 [Homalodisca vitripennis]
MAENSNENGRAGSHRPTCTLTPIKLITDGNNNRMQITALSSAVTPRQTFPKLIQDVVRVISHTLWLEARRAGRRLRYKSSRVNVIHVVTSESIPSNIVVAALPCYTVECGVFHPLFFVLTHLRHQIVTNSPHVATHVPYIPCTDRTREREVWRGKVYSLQKYPPLYVSTGGRTYLFMDIEVRKPA